MLLVFSTFAVTFAGTDDTTQVATGEENTDAVADEIIDEGDYTVEQEDEIADDVDTLDELGIPAESIDKATEENGDIVYSVDAADGVTSDNIVGTDSNGSVSLDITEGTLHNEVVIEDSGRIYIDGKEIVVTEENDSQNNSNVIEASQSSKWSSRCPKTVKRWRYVTKFQRSKIYLNTRAGKLTIAALSVVLAGAGWVGYVYACAAFVREAGANTTALSLIRYKYQAVPNWHCLYKYVEYCYTKANYKGTRTSNITYNYIY